MMNLAGNVGCDRIIAQELEYADIPSVKVDKTKSEVPYSLIGRLRNFTFERAWRYWVVKGKVPLKVAIELYTDPIGKIAVRVDGHCGCPHPLNFGTVWYLNNKKVLSLKEGREVDQWKDKESVLGEVARKILNECLFSDNPVSLGAEAFIEAYHIDTEEGLKLFVDTINKHNVSG